MGRRKPLSDLPQAPAILNAPSGKCQIGTRLGSAGKLGAVALKETATATRGRIVFHERTVLSFA